MDKERLVFACSCEDTMRLEEAALTKGCGGELRTATQLCRSQLDLFKKALATGAPITVGCTQEVPLFSEVASEAGAEASLVFANVRETAGWSKDGRAAGPKMAALLAAAAEPVPPYSLVNLTSEGVTLIYGRDEQAIEAARLLHDHLDVTVLIQQPKDIAPARVTDFPVVKGTIRNAKG